MHMYMYTHYRETMYKYSVHVHVHIHMYTVCALTTLSVLPLVTEVRGVIEEEGEVGGDSEPALLPYFDLTLSACFE